MMITP